MHVAIIADFAQPSGGAQSVAIQSAAALAAAGARVTYIHGIGQEPDARLATPGIARLSLGLADVWSRSALPGAVDGIWSLAAGRRLREALDGLDPAPTILHLHQWTRSLSPSALPLLAARPAPLAITLHDYLSACPNGVYYRFEREEPCALAPLSPACLLAPCDPRSPAHKAVRVLRAAATKLALRGRSLDLVHVSDRGRDTLRPFLPFGSRHHRIDNPVEAARGAPAALPEGGRIAYVGRLTREKGADLVAAAARAAGRSALFIGEGPAEADIRRADPGAEILGWRPRAEVDRILREHVRGVAAPSRWYETGPLTIYEAQAAGLPAVASSRSGAAEKVLHGETGLVVEPTEAALADAFRRLEDRDLAARLGSAAFAAYWAAPRDGASHARDLLRLYEGMLARAR